MNQRWLAFLTIAVLAGITLLLFALRLRPVWTPPPPGSGTDVVLDRPTVTFINPSRGPVDARVTLVLFGDFQCDYCADASTAAQIAQRSFPDDVRVVWKHLPNEYAHPQAFPAAVAAQCAARQGRFWEYHDALYVQRRILSDQQFLLIAREVGLDEGPFVRCLETQDTAAQVRRDMEEAMALRLTATPTLFINDQRVVGAVGVEELLSYVRPILAP